MQKKKLFMTVSAICLSVSLLVSNTNYVSAASTDNASQDAAITVSEGDSSVSDGDSSVSGGDSDNTGGSGSGSDETARIQLEAPTDIHWGDYWTANWDGVSEAEGQYDLEFYRDNELHYSTSWSGLSGDEVTINHSTEITESGTYKFRVRASADYDSETYEDSEWSEWSEEKVYVRPAEQLGTTTAYWDTDGYVNYTTVGGAGGYRIHIYHCAEGSDKFYSSGSTWNIQLGSADVAGQIKKTYIGYRFTSSPGKYYVTVSALSGDIDKIANGEEGPASGIFDTTVNAESISNGIANAEGNTTAEKVENISDSFSKFQLQNAMQTDDTVLEQIAALDTSYMAENNVSVVNKVDESASAYVDVNNIKLVGAAVNADPNSSIGLNVSLSDEKKEISKNYANSVQLEIDLVNGDSSKKGELTIPISITMPIPGGMDASRLEILHFNDDGSYEKLDLKANGDGTVTFTVTHFSTFMFAETGTNTGGNNNGDNNNNNNGNNSNSNDNNNNSNSGNSNVSTSGTTNSSLVSPKTGDSNDFILYCMILAFAGLGALTLYSGKKKY